jgi:Cof subfamily protein (haloacid dehalogenase superfamily)
LIKLFATDLDGTLLRRDGSISPRTKAALEAADRAGLLIAFVTGRPPRWLDDVVEASGHRGVAVGANGAVLYDLATEQVVSVHPLEPAAVVEIGADLRSEFPQVQFAVEYVDGFGAEAGYVHDWEVNPPANRSGNPIPAPALGPLPQIADRPILKLLVKDRGADVDQFLLRAEELLADRGSVTHSSSFGLLEIAAPGVTKASGLAELAASHGFGPEAVVAIGDMPNDVPMLRWAGTSYAVANAHPSAKRAAGAVVGSNEEDAVAIVIEDLLTRHTLP